MSPNRRLQKIADFTEDHLMRTYKQRKDKKRLDHLLYHASYRWQHILRVAQFGKIIAETEDAQVELVVAACLLHDIAWFETTSENSREHGRIVVQVGRHPRGEEAVAKPAGPLARASLARRTTPPPFRPPSRRRTRAAPSSPCASRS